jgi:hypothetical protein
MEVHHHSHTSRKKWTHYFWEFLMLFLAVVLGFIFENQREHFIEKLRVKQYARALVQDLEKDTAMVAEIIRRIKKNLRFTDTLSSYVRDNPGKLRNLDLFILSSVDRYAPYTWNRATIEQVKNSGSLRYFSNQQIVRDISAYDAFTRHMDEDFKNDDEAANRATELRIKVINLDYDKDFGFGLRNNFDSVLKTDYFKNLNQTDRTPLLDVSRPALMNFINAKRAMQKHLMIRVYEELPKLKEDAGALILLLKQEYHFK